jgi:hypothetical protein
MWALGTYNPFGTFDCAPKSPTPFVPSVSHHNNGHIRWTPLQQCFAPRAFIFGVEHDCSGTMD